MSEFSWVTLATNDSYSLGALVLAHSLKRVGTRYQLVVMVTPGVTQTMREKLANVFDLVFEVNILDSKDERNLLLLQRPELGITFTKLHCWRLTQYKKCVFLDADTLVLQNCDELFERDEFSAAPDVGWPDCFNSGVFVYVPSNDTFNSLLKFALDRGSFDGGDQGLLNLYFSDWAHKDISKHLPFIYNMCSTACYSYLPAFKQFGENVKIVHFIGNSKPWLQYFNSETLQVTPSPGFNHLQMIFDHWWSLFCAHVHSNLAPSMGGLAGAFAQMTLREPKSASQGALEEHLRRQGWEAGRIDYLGQDSFDNVWKKICETLSAAPVKEPSPPKQIEAPKAEAVAPAQPETVSVPTEQPVAAAPAPEAIAAAPAPEAVAAAPAPEAIAAAPAPEAVAAAPAPEAIAAAPAPESVAAAPAPVTPIPASEAVAPTPAPETAASAPVAEAVAVTPAPEAATLAATPAPEAATPAATPAPESTTPAPEAVAATPVPEAAAPEAVAATPAPEAVAAAPVPEAVAAPPTPEAAVPAPVSEPIVAAAPETVAAPASEPSAPAPASEPAAPAPAAEPAAPAPVSEPTAPIVPITETPAAAPAPEATPVVAPAAAAPVSEAASTPASTPAAPTEAIVSPVTKEAAPTPAAEATKPAEKKVEEKPSEPKVEKTTEVSKESVAVTEVKEKPATEAPQAAAAAPPAITETPATPQTPDSSKGEIKVEKKAAEGKSTETPVPPPRKSGKNGGATAKKSTKKK